MKKNNQHKKYILVEDTNSVYSEALQHTQVNLDFATIGSEKRIVGITSSIPGEGKSTTIANLACIYAKKDIKVLIIDLDLRRPSIHRFFKIPNDIGVTDFCTKKMDVKDLIKNVNGVDIITSGTTTPFPGKILESEKIVEMIDALKNQYDYIFVDTPPAGTFSDALLISKFVNHFAIVAQYGRTKKAELSETIRLFKVNNIEVIGTILTRVNQKVRSKYKYHYYDYR